MVEERKLTKKEMKALRHLEREQKKMALASESSGSNKKWFILGIVAVLFVGFFGYMVYLSKQQKAEQAAKAKQLVSQGGTIKGNKNAKITLVEYGDLQCPSCQVAQPIVNETLETRKDVKLVFKHFPIESLHPNAISAAVAVEAAGRQGKFFEMMDVLYVNQSEWQAEPNPQSIYEKYAEGLKLDLEKFTKDQQDPVLKKKIEMERDEGINVGVSGTPSFFVNGERIENPGSSEELIQMIDQVVPKK